MGSAYALGLRTALRRWPIVLILFAVSLFCGLCFTAAAWSWLSLSLGKSLATRSLLTDLDVNVFIDLFVYHGESLQTLASVGAMVAGGFGLLGVWLNAAAVVAVRQDESTIAECLLEGLGRYGTFLNLWVLVSLFQMGALATSYWLGHGLMRRAAESTSEMSFYYALAAGCGLAVLLLIFSTTVHDHARIRSVAAGVGAGRALLWAIVFVGRRQWRAVALVVLLLGSGFATWAVYQTVGMLLPANSSTGVTLSLLWGELFVLTRMLFRVWRFAAGAGLHPASEQVPTWPEIESRRPAV